MFCSLRDSSHAINCSELSQLTKAVDSKRLGFLHHNVKNSNKYFVVGCCKCMRQTKEIWMDTANIDEGMMILRNVMMDS